MRFGIFVLNYQNSVSEEVLLIEKYMKEEDIHLATVGRRTYVSPEMKVIGMTARNAILSESSWSTGEDGNPKTPVW